MVDLSRAARREWASHHKLTGTKLARDYLLVFAPLLVTVAVLYVRRNFETMGEALLVLAGTAALLLVGVPLVARLWRVMFASRLGLRDDDISALSAENTRLASLMPDPTKLDIEIRIQGNPFVDPYDKDIWLVVFPAEIASHIRDGAVLRFELEGTSNGKPISTNNYFYAFMHKKQLGDALSRCLQNPLLVPAGTIWPQPLGFFVRHSTASNEKPELDGLQLLVTEEHSKRRYRFPIPGAYDLAGDEHLIVESALT